MMARRTYTKGLSRVAGNFHLVRWIPECKLRPSWYTLALERDSSAGKHRCPHALRVDSSLSNCQFDRTLDGWMRHAATDSLRCR